MRGNKFRTEVLTQEFQRPIGIKGFDRDQVCTIGHQAAQRTLASDQDDMR